MMEFHCGGVGYERGRAHGEAFAPLIREHIEATCCIEPGYEEQINDLVQCMENSIRRWASGQLSELHGIADGAGVDFASIMKLNFWPEITSGTVGFHFCSLIAFSDVEGGPIMGKTSDHPLVSLRFLALQRVTMPAGHSYMRGTFVGTLGTRAGINDAGLAVCGATIVPKTVNRAGVPVMVLIQAILERCATVEEAIAMAERMPSFNYAAHIMVGDAAGNVVVIERLPDRMAVRRPENGVLFNTNHPLAPETRDQDGASEAIYENSHARYAKLQKLIPQVPRTVAGMQTILRDHTQPGAICQHGEPANLHTTGAYVLLPSQGLMLMAPGCPCQHEFVPLTLSRP